MRVCVCVYERGVRKGGGKGSNYNTHCLSDKVPR